MLTLLKRYRELIVVGALLIYPFAQLLAKAQAQRQVTFVDRAVLALTSPLQRLLVWTFDGVVGGVEGYVALRGVREHNVALVEENARLRGEANQSAELKAENERLRQLLAFSEQTAGVEISARVIAVNPAANVLSVRINKGEKDGVQAGLPVVTRDGVVGQVVLATGGTATVALITDLNSRLGIRVQRSRARATAAGEGNNRHLRLENALRVEDIQESDVVVTSGTDGVFPPGLVVGKVTALTKKNHGMFQNGEIIPAVDMTKLEELLVLSLGPLSQLGQVNGSTP